jgi:hypothetical protein
LPPNSRGPRGVRSLSVPSLTGSLLPSPFPFEHPAQRLAAGRATKPPRRIGVRACKMHFAPGTIATKKSGIRCWALALAQLHSTLARRLRRRRKACLGCRCPLAFGATRPVLTVLGLAFFSTVGGPPILLTGTSSPPATSFGAALGTTVPGLGMFGVKGFLAILEQAVALPRLTSTSSPLNGSSSAASLMWDQGSCELPTAKPRTRRSFAPLPQTILRFSRFMFVQPARCGVVMIGEHGRCRQNVLGRFTCLPRSCFGEPAS